MWRKGSGVCDEELWKINKGRKQHNYGGFLGHQNHTHSVSVTGAWTPAGQNNDCVSLLEEASSFAYIHGKVDTQVNVFSPNIVGGRGVKNWEDATVQMGLPSCLGITSHSNDGGTGPVPGKQMSRPASTQIREQKPALLLW